MKDPELTGNATRDPAALYHLPRFRWGLSWHASDASLGRVTAFIFKLLKDRRMHRLAVVGAAALAGLSLWAWQAGADIGMLLNAWRQLEGFLGAHPWGLFVALVVLPALPVPSSALLLLAGAVWGERPLLACAICLLAMWLNQTWTYWLAAAPARRIVERWIAQGVVRIPAVGPGQDLRLTLLMRLTPGVPLFVQNYVLGFMKVPFRLYSPVSIACSGMFVCGIVLAGAGVSTGSWMPAMAGAGLLVAAVVVVQMLRKWIKPRGKRNLCP